MRYRWKIMFALMLVVMAGLLLAMPAYAQTPVPVVPADGRMLTDKDLENITKLLAVIAGFITLTVVPAAIALYNLFKNGQAQNAAAAVIGFEQGNRRLVNEGLEAVTMQSPATGTGDARVDKAMETLLQQSDASARASVLTGSGTGETPAPPKAPGP